MNISKEVRIGFLVLSALVIFFAGFYFLKGSDIFSNDVEYYSYFESVDGLQKSTFVQVKGLNVGQVTDLELAGSKGVKVTLTITSNVKVPTGSKVNLASADLMGSKVIRLELGDGQGTEPAGAILASGIDGGALDKISGELTPRLEELKGTISSLNAALANINSLVGADNRASINETINSLRVTSENLAHMTSVLDKESAQISGILRNTNSITGNLAKNNDTIQHILSNVNRLSGQLANAPVQQTIADLQKTTAQIQAIMEKVNNNQGSLGMFVNNKDAYNNLNSSLKSVTNLTDDLKAHPGRYIRISIFGRKKKE